MASKNVRCRTKTGNALQAEPLYLFPAESLLMNTAVWMLIAVTLAIGFGAGTYWVVGAFAN